MFSRVSLSFSAVCLFRRIRAVSHSLAFSLASLTRHPLPFFSLFSCQAP